VRAASSPLAEGEGGLAAADAAAAIADHVRYLAEDKTRTI
jgi:hypothetical protein